MATFKNIFMTAMVLIVLANTNAAPNGKPGLKIPDECKGKGFCHVKPEGYDEMQEAITKLLSSKFTAQSIGDRIGIDEQLTTRYSPESERHNCPYIIKTEPAYSYSHPDDTETDYIIQHQLLNQRIEIVTCAPTNATEKMQNEASQECFQHVGLASFNLKSSCQSTTAKRSLFVYDSKLNQIKEKTYDVPCCCSCQITRV